MMMRVIAKTNHFTDDELEDMRRSMHDTVVKKDQELVID